MQASNAWSLLFGADLGGLHGGLGFGLGLVYAVANDDGGGGRRRVAVDDFLVLASRTM